MTTATTSKGKSKPPTAATTKKKTSPAPKKKLTRQKTEGSNMATVTVGDAGPEFFPVPSDGDALEIPEADVTLTFSEGEFLADGESIAANGPRIESGVVINVATGDVERAELIEIPYDTSTAPVGEPLPVSPGTYSAIHQTTGNGWSLVNGDSVEVVKTIPENSVDFSIYSPPFASLYTYSNSDRDMGNCTDHEEFHEHFRFLLRDMLRITKPGRNMSVHCMDLPTSKTRDGEIGLADFPGEIIRSCREMGWIWHSKVTVWKDPVTAMQRTKALGLLYKQLRKDSCMSRMGIPDYVLTFRKPGENPEPVKHGDAPPTGGTDDEHYFPVSLWQKWASPVWHDIDASDTLQHRSAREEMDERHVCPLQLEVIRRCVRLWSNPEDVVFSPFAGIGSEGYVALEEGRRFVGCELKPSYYEQAARNLATAEPKARGRQVTLFDMGGVR